jgi:hypothetical protein
MFDLAIYYLRQQYRQNKPLEWSKDVFSNFVNNHSEVIIVHSIEIRLWICAKNVLMTFWGNIHKMSKDIFWVLHCNFTEYTKYEFY